MVPDLVPRSETRPRSRRNSAAVLRIFIDTLRLSGWIRSRGDAMTCVETAACARIDGCAWLGRDHAAYIEIATALEDSQHIILIYRRHSYILIMMPSLGGNIYEEAVMPIYRYWSPAESKPISQINQKVVLNTTPG